MNNEGFNSMGLKEDLLKMIDEKGFEQPTPIQQKTIPLAIAGLDVMGQAQTGTGKTASFGIPILNKVRKGGGIQALVICPTRELAVQVREEIASLGKALQLNALSVYGGQSIEIQMRALGRRPEIIVGTPGRLLDHLRRGSIKLGSLSFVVIDEADEMLDMGFLPDIETVLQQCPQERQTFLFSATLVDEVRELGQKFMHKPEIVLIESPERTVPVIEQVYYQVNPRRKVETMCRILDVEQPPVSLIFCRTKRSADELARILNSRGYTADALHGDMSQRERDSVMHRFRTGNARILVATDLAARGLDVELVTHVFNYDIPEELDSYIHRTGRTGRAGRTGVAITLVEPSQLRQLRLIERHTGKRMKPGVLPTLQEAVQRHQDLLLDRLLKAAEEPGEIYLDMAAKILEQKEAKNLLAAALKIMADDTPDLETTEFDETDRGITAHVELPAGRMQGIHPRRLVELLTANTSLNPKQIGDIEINSNTTYVEVPMSSIDEVYQAFIAFERGKKGSRPPRPQKHRSKKIETGHRVR
ncbi:MAG: DEAD/DEAH box helicase [Syntrophomonadaceae bacterium]|nr:DEAD/DEAH box helicase [Syntrophomonadaceae bacterium]